MQKLRLKLYFLFVKIRVDLWFYLIARNEVNRLLRVFDPYLDTRGPPQSHNPFITTD